MQLNFDFLKRNKTQSFCDLLDKVVSRKDFYSDLCNYSDNDIITFKYRMAYIIKYYIASRDKKADYSFEELFSGKPADIWFYKPEERFRNVIQNGFFTHSCNGVFTDSIKKHGLDNEKNHDKELNAKLEYLESILGKSKYNDQQTNEGNELYFCAPGECSIEYAMSYSPERLYLGILKQDRGSTLPIKVGETKIEYLTRVLDKKITELNITDANVRELALEVITSFCSKRPIIVFFHIYSKNYKLHPKNETQKKGYDSVDLDNIMNDILTTERFFTTSLGGMDSNNLGDLVDNVKIPPEEVGILEIPDNFEIMQICAINRGMKEGELIDYFTGEQVLNNNNFAKESKKNSLQEQIHTLVELKNSILDENQTSVNEESSSK